MTHLFVFTSCDFWRIKLYWMFLLFYGYECLYNQKNLMEGTRLCDISREGRVILNWIKIRRLGGCGLDKLWPVVNKIINFLVHEVREIRWLAEELSASKETLILFRLSYLRVCSSRLVLFCFCRTLTWIQIFSHVTPCALMSVSRHSKHRSASIFRVGLPWRWKQ